MAENSQRLHPLCRRRRTQRARSAVRRSASGMVNMARTAKDSVPLDPDYIRAFGRAMFIFARLEWQAVWCCEKISPGIIQPLSERTAGHVAKTLLSLVDRTPPAVRVQFQEAANRFNELVVVRNKLAHGRPCTVPEGEQRLSFVGGTWTGDSIDQAADDFAECGAELNKLFYGALGGAD